MNSSHPEDSVGNELVDLPSQRLSDEESQNKRSRDLNSQAGIELEDNNVGHDLRSVNDPDETARMWADRKAETGYDSYVDYLEAYEAVYPHADLVRECLLDAWRHQLLVPKAQTCAIFELQEGRSPCPSLDLQCSSPAAATIFSALRRPSPTGGVRILLWEASGLDEGMLSALGLGLKIHPEVFRALLARHAGTGRIGVVPDASFSRWSMWRKLIDGFDERGTAPEVVLLGQYLVTTARHYLTANLEAPPVILIFRLDKISRDKPTQKMNYKFNRIFFYQELATSAVSNPIRLLPVWMQEYVHFLKIDFERRRERSSGIMELSFRSLSPLLQFYVFRFRDECDFIRTEFLDFTLPQNKFWYESEILNQVPHRKGTGKIKRLSDLFEVRYWLRRMVEDSEQHCQRLRKFRYSQNIRDTSQNEPCIAIEDELQQAHLEALRLETEIREYLQLQTGELALQESRKSIELSNSQIEEEKRGQSKHLKQTVD